MFNANKLMKAVALLALGAGVLFASCSREDDTLPPTLSDTMQQLEVGQVWEYAETLHNLDSLVYERYRKVVVEKDTLIGEDTYFIMISEMFFDAAFTESMGIGSVRTIVKSSSHGLYLFNTETNSKQLALRFPAKIGDLFSAPDRANFALDSDINYSVVGVNIPITVRGTHYLATEYIAEHQTQLMLPDDDGIQFVPGSTQHWVVAGLGSVRDIYNILDDNGAVMSHFTTEFIRKR